MWRSCVSLRTMTWSGDYDDGNAVWDVWVDSANPPARTTVAAALANARWLLEIAVVAAA
jgi:enamine deaminase RidA (YjgF/YER057c/UK114 family)